MRIPIYLLVISFGLSGSALSFAQQKAKEQSSQEQPGQSAKDDSSKESSAPNKTRTEPGLLPIAGGSSDYGYGIGAMASLAHFEPGYDPYQYRLEAVGTAMFRSRGGQFEVPFQDYYLKGTFPQFLAPSLRLTTRVAYTRSATLQYSGIGNASQLHRTWKSIDEDAQPEAYRRALEHYDYDRVHPMASAALRIELRPPFFLNIETSYTYSRVRFTPDSQLGQDLRQGPPLVREMLRGTETHGVLLFRYEILWDSRDDESSPTRGMYHKAGLRLSPHLDGLPYAFQGANLTLRFYVPVLGPDLVLATRFVADALWGEPPFSELARYDEGYALGGADGVRGVPGQRYYGKVKVFGNLEARARLFHFHLFGQQSHLGVALFGDGGRVWTDFRSRPELDGTGLGLKYGLGGGLRLQQGKTFVARADVAYSPDADPVSFYVAAGQAF